MILTLLKKVRSVGGSVVESMVKQLGDWRERYLNKKTDLMNGYYKMIKKELIVWKVRQR